MGFQARRSGLIWVGPFLAALITVILFVGKGRLSLIHSDASSALLLAVPTLFAALVARPVDHSLTARLLLGSRLLVMLAGLATFVAAASLVGAWRPHTQHGVWEWAGFATAFSTALLFAALALNGLRSVANRPKTEGP